MAEKQRERFLQDFSEPTEASIKIEKQKARELRKSSWWQKKISNASCQYCGRPLKKSEVTMDHFIPLSMGGKSIKSNLVVSCKECNNQKKYLNPLEWEDFLQRAEQRCKK